MKVKVKSILYCRFSFKKNILCIKPFRFRHDAQHRQHHRGNSIVILCALLLVLTGKNCLSNIFMANLNNRSNYIYVSSHHRRLLRIACGDWLSSSSSSSLSIGKYRVQCILQSIQCSNTNFAATESNTRTHTMRENFLTIFVYSNLHFVFD